MSDDSPLRYFLHLAGRDHELGAVRGREAIARAFRFELEMSLDPGERFEFDPDLVLGSEASLMLVRGGAVVRRRDGIITDASVSISRTGRPLVRATLEPRFALSRHRSDVRVFRDKTAPEIVAIVLEAIGVAPELRLATSYERRAYCVQYRETDHDFVMRLLEDEGIFFFFLESDVMVLGDRAAAYEPIAGDRLLPFRAAQGTDAGREAVFAWGQRARMAPGKISLRDWTAEHPSLDMDVTSATSWPAGPEHYDFPGEYTEPAAGARKAALRAEAVRCAQDTDNGRSTSARLSPGLVFTLTEAPGAPETEIVVTSVDHAWQRHADAYEVAFDALPATVVYRPPLSTTVPRLVNPLPAYVTGARGDDIHTDEMGRVKIHFPWDRAQPRDDASSDWVPVIQDNTGHSVSIPRVGWEVLVHFLEGDPDRPVVLGRVYNPEDAFPEGLPEGKTRTALRSLSSPREEGGGGSTGFNEIRFEDKAGGQQLSITAEKDERVVVANDKREEVGATERRVIQGNETIAIGRNETVTVGAAITATVQGNQSLTVGSDRHLSVKGAEAASIEGDHALTVGSIHFRRIGGADRVAVDKSLTERIGAVSIETSVKHNVLMAGKISSLTVGGAVVEMARESKTENAGKARAETVGALVSVKAGEDITTAVGKTRNTSVGGPLSIIASKAMSFEATDAFSTVAAGCLVKTDKITLKVKGSEVTIGGGAIAIKGPKIDITVSGPNLQLAGDSAEG